MQSIAINYVDLSGMKIKNEYLYPVINLASHTCDGELHWISNAWVDGLEMLGDVSSGGATK